MEEKILTILLQMQADLSVLKQDVSVLKIDMADVKNQQTEIWDVLNQVALEIVTKDEFYKEINPIKRRLAMAF